jgi:hypothetical protein
LLLAIPACGDSGDGDGDGDGDTSTSTSTSTETSDTGDTSDTGGDGDGDMMCDVQFVAVASGTDAAGGNRPCGVAYGAEGSVAAEAQAECGAGDTCYVQIQPTPGYCGVMVMSPDATQAWPGVTEECTSANLEAMLLDQCKTAAGGVDCEVRCVQCGNM